MKLTDEQSKQRLEEIENFHERMTIKNADFQMNLIDEVKRLKEENTRLGGLYERERNIAEQAQSEVERLRGEYAKLGNALVQAQYHLSKAQYMSAEDVVNEAIQEGIQG